MNHITRLNTKLESLRDIFGRQDVLLDEDAVRVGNTVYPIVDDVIILLDESQYSPGLRERLRRPPGTGSPVRADRDAPEFAPDIQFTFGEEWQEFPEILPEHREEFEHYFDVVDVDSLRDVRVCDLGCGIGRWSSFLQGRCRELVLVDFSDAIFVARRNLADADNALFFMGDLKRLPFRDDFADFILCLGVLHHLPTSVLDEVRRIGRYAPQVLIYLYYALDNRPAHYRKLLGGATAVRTTLSRITNARARAALTWALAAGVYLPLVGIGYMLRPFGLASHVPLWDFYRDKSVLRIRQDVYDRFFTRIEQRVSRDQILGLSDTYSSITVSEQVPYWHFLARR
jgi:SAM-dependent methyltransferase